MRYRAELPILPLQLRAPSPLRQRQRASSQARFAAQIAGELQINDGAIGNRVVLGFGLAAAHFRRVEEAEIMQRRARGRVPKRMVEPNQTA